MNNIRLLIADDHQMFRAGIINLLGKEPSIAVVGEASNGQQAVELARRLQPDLVLMDVGLPLLNGIEATQVIMDENYGAKVLVLTSIEEEETILAMINAGAKGYVPKEAPIDELVLAIKSVATGGSYFAKEVSIKLFAMLKHADQHFAVKKPTSGSSLTDRELEVLRHIAQELSNKEIAAKLFISPRTVETHRRNLLNKLKVKNTAGLVKFYYNNIKESPSEWASTTGT